jgi:hypothetical protein
MILPISDMGKKVAWDNFDLTLRVRLLYHERLPHGEREIRVELIYDNPNRSAHISV